MESLSKPEDGEIPWHLGVYDAHCHPTDTVSTFDNIPRMKAQALTAMASRRQDQHLVADLAAKYGLHLKTEHSPGGSGAVVPAFGWHPWFSHQLYDDTGSHAANSQFTPSKFEHYSRVITPSPKDDETFIESLPDLLSLSGLLNEIRDHLLQYPLALVGEIGLDRAFRIPLSGQFDFTPAEERPALAPDDDRPELTPGGREGRGLSKYRVHMDQQRRVLTAQLNLAGNVGRAVSVHGVAAHGVVYETLRETWRGHEKQSQRARRRQANFDRTAAEDENEESRSLSPLPFPPRICLHSFSGSADIIPQYLHPSVPTTIYFSFSKLVNFSNASDKAIATVQAVPADRILVESDLHTAGQKMDDLLEDVIRSVCGIKKWSLEDGVQQLGRNWKQFIFGDDVDTD